MYSKEEAYQKIAELTEKFSYQIDAYKRDYNETQTRQDFINPFFEALGWDMNNRQGAWEAYREVIHEDKLKVGGVTTAPDYSFRLIGGQRLFFVEAKKPSIYIKDDITPAYQVRLYGWNAKLAISVVTDFEEFAVYECSKKPLKTDKASKGRINYYTYKDYLKEFDFFWNTFSKQQVIKGGLIKFQQSDKKGTATVDKDFLESLDIWRKELAANIYKNNGGINEDELNYAVQQTIDRIIFLRIAEDRGLEPYGQLKSSLQNIEQYKELFRQFRIADDKYNSGLFHFKKEKDNSKEPDNISGKLIIENKVIKSIISSLYPPQSEFLFNVMPVEILGSAYEQFLGKQIIVKGSRATIEEKPEVRKAGGVYYTPQYIVEYIVENTVGKLCQDKTPKEISKLKIVDPACGSGSFLLGAYQYLLQWHSLYYTNNPQKSKQKDAALTPDGSLTTAEKKRILLNNIYGVDIDRNATEVTKLSLLLKCMEGETTASVNTQMTFFHERILPSLENNIKSGNSLIDVDFYDTEFDFGEEKKIKPFNWQQGFPEVFKQGGFDCVIGNPPYFNVNTLNKSILKYLEKNYNQIHTGYNDIMYYFIYKGITLLNRSGNFGMITSNYYLGNKYAEPLRQFLKKYLKSVINFKNYLVFNGVSIHTSIILCSKENNSDKILFYDPLGEEIAKNNLEASFNCLVLNKSELEGNWIIAEGKELSLIEKLKINKQLGEISLIEKGSTSGKNDVFNISKKLAE
jgi:type I restriction-modification system DNA methylase subunit